jgi:O-antigen biosynthesis protein WbqP
MKRFLDILLALVLFLFLFFLILLLAILIKLTSNGPILYWSDRIGQFNKIFRMPKFRTMKLGAPQLASHRMIEPLQYLTLLGTILRKTSLDEIPQLWSILVGDMTFVGPRPALFNQYDLIELRTRKGIHNLVPGLTGWAQVNGRDELTIAKKVSFDAEYLKKKSFIFDLKILYLTLIKIIRREGIRH